jgi:acyl carrier protein
MLESLEGWNSMAMLGFMAIADEHCGLTLSPRQFINCRTVDDLVGLLQVSA